MRPPKYVPDDPNGIVLQNWGPVTLQYGRNYGVPPVSTAWGARAILTDGMLDLVSDRQGGEGPRKEGLMTYLRLHYPELHVRVAEMSFDPRWDELQTVFENEDAIVVASTNASFGYLYLRAWFKVDEIV
jgi:hypothetical protein